MNHKFYVGLSFTILLLVGCHPNTGHNLTKAETPTAIAAGESAQVVYQVSAPDAWKPLRSRLHNPQLQYSTSPTFEDERSQKCQVATGGGELAIRCQMPTEQFDVGTTVYYRIAYTFDGNREVPLSVNELNVEVNLANASPYEQYEHLTAIGASYENALAVLGEPTRDSSRAYIWEFEDGSAIELGKQGGTAYYGSGIPQ